jgi:hypothetical protein
MAGSGDDACLLSAGSRPSCHSMLKHVVALLPASFACLLGRTPCGGRRIVHPATGGGVTICRAFRGLSPRNRPKWAFAHEICWHERPDTFPSPAMGVRLVQVNSIPHAVNSHWATVALALAWMLSNYPPSAVAHDDEWELSVAHVEQMPSEWWALLHGTHSSHALDLCRPAKGPAQHFIVGNAILADDLQWARCAEFAERCSAVRIQIRHANRIATLPGIPPPSVVA